MRRMWHTRTSHERGYALLMVMFIAALMVAAVMTVAPNILTEGKREKEEEMIWRGKQYVRGIKLYYRKLGRFPTSMDDLTKAKIGTLRFMRQAYKDPMNKVDGSWRLIYVGPAGQLIGSLKPPQTINIAAAGTPGPGTPAVGLAGAVQPGAAPGQARFGAQTGVTPVTSGGDAQKTDATGDSGESPSGLTPTQQADTPTIIGGNIIGVGSKVPGRSIRIYEKAKNYRLFEFIWDPSKDVLAIGGQGTQIGTPVVPGQATGPGQTPLGVQPTPNPANPQNNPQQPPPNSNPNPQQP